MLLTVGTEWLLGTLLTSVRLGALLLMSPLFSLGRLPARINVLLVIGLSAAINTIVHQYPTLDVAGVEQLLPAMLRELAVGALMAFGIHCAFAALSFGGRILDLQMGFGVANLVNPSTNEQAPLLGMLLLSVAVMTFFLVGGHHWIARGFVQSFTWFPLAAPIKSISLDAVVRQFGMMFSLGFILVSPIVAILLLLDVAMAIATRTMPQMNLFMLSMPIKIAIGLIVLALIAPHFETIFARIFNGIFDYWRQLA
jgi:flagellar biosynthetic protein FliR